MKLFGGAAQTNGLRPAPRFTCSILKLNNVPIPSSGLKSVE